MVFRTGFLHIAVSVLRNLLFLQMSRGPSLTGGLHPGHFLVDGGLRVRLDTAARFALRVTETEMKSVKGTSGVNTVSISCVKIRVFHFLSRQYPP